jgi:hypothetical protein
MQKEETLWCVLLSDGGNVCFFGWKVAKFSPPKKMGWQLVSLDFKGEIWHFLPQEHHDTLQGHLEIYSFEKLSSV